MHCFLRPRSLAPRQQSALIDCWPAGPGPKAPRPLALSRPAMSPRATQPTLKLLTRSSAAMRLLESMSRVFSSSTSVTLNSMLRPTSSSNVATRCRVRGG